MGGWEIQYGWVVGKYKFNLVSSEDVAGVDLVVHIVQATVISICDDGLGHFLEFLQIIYDEGAEEGGAVFEGRLIDDYLCTFGLSPADLNEDRNLSIYPF